MIKEIIVGIDGSEESLHAYKSACLLSKNTGASIHVLYVVDQRRTELPYMYSTTFFDLSYEKIYIPPDQELLSFYKKLRRDMVQFGKNCLKTIKDIDCPSLSPPETEITEGIPFEILIDKAGDESMILLGQYGENKNFHKNLLGSTVEEVIRKSDAPVMVCSHPVTKIKRIACFDDGSSSYERVKKFIDTNFSENSVDITRYTQRSDADTEDAVRIKNEAELLEAVEKEKFDIVLIGAHGKHKVTEYLLGSHAVHLVRKSSCPVIIVK